MVLLIQSVSLSLQSFAVGIWQSHPLQQYIPRFERTHEGTRKS